MAREEGFDEIAEWFETLAKAERSNANRYEKALNELVEIQITGVLTPVYVYDIA